MSRSPLSRPRPRELLALALILSGCVMNLAGARRKVFEDRRRLRLGIASTVDQFGGGLATMEGATLLPGSGRVGYRDASLPAGTTLGGVDATTGAFDADASIRYFTAQYRLAPLVLVGGELADRTGVTVTWADGRWAVRPTRGER